MRPYKRRGSVRRLRLTLTLVLSLRGRGVGPGLCDRLLSTALPGTAALPDAGGTPIRQAQGRPALPGTAAHRAQGSRG